MKARIFLLALGTFAIGTEAFMIAGFLPELAQNFNVSISAAGQLVTVFSLAYAFGSPILTTMTGLVERRRLLIWSILLFAAGNFLCGYAQSYEILLLGRIIAAAGAGLFVPAAMTTASALATPDKRGRSLSIVIGGQSVALILGVPLGTWMAFAIDWRMTFWLVGILSVLAAVLIRLFLPILSSTATASLKERLLLLKRPLILTALISTLAWGIGILVVYTYVANIFEQFGATWQTISLVLFIAGIAGFVGVNTGGYAADRFGSSITIVFSLSLLAVAVTALSVLPPTSDSLMLGAAALTLWGFSGYVFNPAQQHRLIGLSGEAANIVLSLHASFIYLGSALGALIGGLILKYGSVTFLGYAGGISILIALIFFGISRNLAAMKTVQK